MTGSIDECSYSKLRELRKENQHSLASFGGGSEKTYIAVVRKPNDTGIDDTCDELMTELGMPTDALEEFWAQRSLYRDSATIHNPHNVAYERNELDRRFRKYCECNDAAQRAVQRVVERVQSGEDIVLVCFEDGDKKCHRYELLDHIKTRLRQTV